MKNISNIYSTIDLALKPHISMHEQCTNHYYILIYYVNTHNGAFRIQLSLKLKMIQIMVMLNKRNTPDEQLNTLHTPLFERHY